MINGNWFVLDMLVKEKQAEIERKARNAWWYSAENYKPRESFSTRIRTWLGLQKQPVVSKQTPDCVPC